MEIDQLTSIPTLTAREGGKDGWNSFNVEPEHLIETVRALQNSYFFDALADLAAIDDGEGSGRRYGCVYHFFSHTRKRFVRVCAMAKNPANPVLPTISHIFGNADWFEREAYDMMGIVFEGHPNLKRMLMWDDYPWHPLRKDFPLAGKPAPIPETFEGEEPMRVIPSPMEGGPFYSEPGDRFTTDREPRSHADPETEGL